MTAEVARIVNGDTSRFYDIAPTAKPRMTRRDKWAPSKAAKRYFAFRDAVAYAKLELPEDFFHVVFLIRAPLSWSNAKRQRHIGRPHLVKPDKDNLEKGLIDAVFRNRDDAHVWNCASTKLWSGHAGIVISDSWFPFWELPVNLVALVQGTLPTVDFDPRV